jgi:hypothetical protein
VGQRESNWEYVYSAVYAFWTAEEIVELAGGPTGCGEMARVGCSFAWN